MRVSLYSMGLGFDESLTAVVHLESLPAHEREYLDKLALAATAGLRYVRQPEFGAGFGEILEEQEETSRANSVNNNETVVTSDFSLCSGYFTSSTAEEILEDSSNQASENSGLNCSVFAAYPIPQDDTVVSDTVKEILETSNPGNESEIKYFFDSMNAELSLEDEADGASSKPVRSTRSNRATSEFSELIEATFAGPEFAEAYCRLGAAAGSAVGFRGHAARMTAKVNSGFQKIMSNPDAVNPEELQDEYNELRTATGDAMKEVLGEEESRRINLGHVFSLILRTLVFLHYAPIGCFFAIMEFCCMPFDQVCQSHLTTVIVYCRYILCQLIMYCRVCCLITVLHQGDGTIDLSILISSIFRRKNRRYLLR